jgi:Flp pilus assembly pilin Flp
MLLGDKANKAARPRRDQNHGGFSGVIKHFVPPASGSHQQFSNSISSSRRGREVKQVLNIFDLFANAKREEGQTMAEYGVVLAVITIAVFGALALLSGNIVSAVNRVAAYIS